ncbi:hypothetical protein KRR26_07785 [Corallococcus sp. M34]|nr:hypothetical protein [Citreicoccus inhibens]
MPARGRGPARGTGRASSLPMRPGDPFTEPPQPKGEAARIVEEASSWNRMWRPFLYESIAWFLGAFLILSGTLYLVFESWAGMTSVTRSLVVFLMTAGYSAGFSIWGNFLARREALRQPGRILGLIGSAVAPLVGIALGPMGLGDALQLDGVSPVLLVPLLFGWAAVAAVFARKPLDAFDAPSRRHVQVALVATMLMMGLAPLVARLGGLAVWLNVLPCGLFFLLSRKAPPTPREGGALGFVIAAPLFLAGVFAVRLHVALASADVAPSVGTYAPFAAFVLATCLRFRNEGETRAAEPLALVVVALQVACLAAGAAGAAPALFLTAVVVTWTLWTLARGPIARLPWLYPAYGAAYLAYASTVELVPGPARSLLAAIKQRMGYAPGNVLPYQYGALSAVPFILAGIVLAARFRWRGERTSEVRDLGLSEVLLRATAVALPCFVLYGHLGTDARPAFWAALSLSLVGLGAGLLLERFYLVAVGAGVFFLLPFSALGAYGTGVASVVCGAFALALAGVGSLCTKRTRAFLASTVGVVSTIVFLLSAFAGSGVAEVVGMGLGGTAALVAAWTVRSEPAFAFAAFLLAATLPKLAFMHGSRTVAPVMAAVALGLAVLGERGGIVRRLGVPAVVYAVVAFIWGMAAQVTLLGAVVLVCAAAVAVASRSFPAIRPLAVVMAAFALLPDMSSLYRPWNGWMTPWMSQALFAVWSLGSSVLTARRGRSPSTLAAGLVALVFPLFAVAVGPTSQREWHLLAASFVALLTSRSLHPSLSLGMATVYAVAGLTASGPVALLGLATVLAVLAVLEEVPAVLRVAAGGQRFAWVGTLGSVAVLALATVRWTDSRLALLMVGTCLLPLLWTRATRQPFFASLMVVFSVAGILVVGRPFSWASGLALFALVLVRAVEHVPAASRALLRSTDEVPRRALSLWMQVQLGLLGAVLWMVPWSSPLALVLVAGALALLPGPLPSLRVSGAALLVLTVPSARPYATVLLLGLALAEHHVSSALHRFFRAPRDGALRPAAVGMAFVLTVLPAAESSTPWAIASVAGVLFAAAFLLSQRWLLAAAVVVLASAPLGEAADFARGVWRPEAGPWVLGVALMAAALAAVCQSESVQGALTRWSERLTPGLEGSWSEPLWVGGALVLAGVVVTRLLDVGPGALTPMMAGMAALTALVLMVTRTRWMAGVAQGLLAASIVAAVPLLWAPAVLGGAGLVLCIAGLLLDARDVEVGEVLHHGGWVLSLLAFGGLRDPRHLSLSLCLAFGLGCAWTVVVRRREREWVGWLASLVAAHGAWVHLGAVYSSGRGPEFILPYFGASSAVLATVVLLVAGERERGRMGQLFTLVSLTELTLGLMWMEVAGGAVREALVASGSLAVLLFALVHRAVTKRDEGFAWLAQAVLTVGYLCVRRMGQGAVPGMEDSLAALVGGALFNGLHAFAMREGADLPAFRRPALVGAYLFPILGLLAVPWASSPLMAAALLVGHAAHFAALATHPERRGLASLASVVAFNAALVWVWFGTGAGQLQYYAIPAGLSLLALLRVFRDGVEEDTYARLRAVAASVIYMAGAWEPLQFSHGSAMILCVFLCLVGVGAGIALRIRSYVYLGTGFLVTCVAANLVRFGMRDHRVGAAFLSLLGLLVVGFMVLLSAHRAALLQRYERVKDLLSTWEG